MELRRKILHVIIAAVLAAFIWYDAPYIRIALFVVLALGVILSLIEKRCRIPGVSWVLDQLERKQDRKTFPGKSLIMMVAGVLLTQLFFNKLLVVTGLFVIIFGDSLAHILGKKFGRVTIPWDATKHLEGRVVGFVLTSLVAILFWETIFISVNYWIVFAGVFAGMLIESLPLRKIGLDDNLVVPFVTALTIYVLTPTLV